MHTNTPRRFRFRLLLFIYGISSTVKWPLVAEIVRLFLIAVCIQTQADTDTATHKSARQPTFLAEKNIKAIVIDCQLFN